MPQIGRVLSPEVAAALIRRGESTGGESYIRREPDVRTTVPGGGGAADELALLREERLAEQAALDEARALRGEEFAEEQFEFQMSEAEKNRIERGEKLTDREKADQAKAVTGARKQGQEILSKIAGILRQSRRPNPDTGQPDPDAVREAQTIAQGMWVQFQNLPIPDEEKKQALDAMRQMLGTVPPSRTGGGAPPQAQDGPPSPFGEEAEQFLEDSVSGISRGIREGIPALAQGIAGAASKPSRFIDPILRSALSIPTRTP